MTWATQAQQMQGQDCAFSLQGRLDNHVFSGSSNDIINSTGQVIGQHGGFQLERRMTMQQDSVGIGEHVAAISRDAIGLR